MTPPRKPLHETLAPRALSVALAFALVTALDIALAPLRGGEVELSSRAAALALDAWDLGRAFVWLLVLQLVLALPGAWRPREPWRLRERALVVVLVLAEVAQVYVQLTRYVPFRGQLTFIAAHTVLMVVLVTAEWARAASSSAGRLIAVGLAGASIGCVAMTAIVFVGQYPTLHVALLGGALLLGQVAAQRALAAPAARRVVALLVSLWVALVAVGAWHVQGFDAGERARLRDATAAGGYAMVVWRPDARWFECSCAAPQPVDQTTSLETFRSHSGMPPLDGLRADDYHVLVVMIDALRFDQTTLSDPTLTTMPNLSAFATRDAFVFTRAFAPSSTTMQVVASLFRLSLPSSAGVAIERLRHWRGGFTTERATLPEQFQAAGYLTFASVHKGADLMEGVSRGFADYWASSEIGAATEDDKVVDHALASIDRRGDRRFFGWVFLGAPHDPYLPRDKSSKTDLARYRDEIRYSDAQLRRLLDGLESRGLLDRTIVLILGDHGEEFGEHGQTHHAQDVFTEEVHVPLVVRVPGFKGTTVTSTMSTAYVLPSLLLAMTGALHDDAVTAIVSRLAPVIVATHGAVVSELLSDTKMLVSLRTDDHTIVHQVRLKTTTHFDTSRDPGEKTPVTVEHGGLCKPGAGRPEDEPLRAYLGIRACLFDYQLRDARKPAR